MLMFDVSFEESLRILDLLFDPSQMKDWELIWALNQRQELYEKAKYYYQMESGSILNSIYSLQEEKEKRGIR